MKLTLAHALAPVTATIKQVMHRLDLSGLRVAYLTDAAGRLAGVVSDGELRKAIISGRDVHAAVGPFRNPQPVVLTEAELKDPVRVRRQIDRLRQRMADARHILVTDRDQRPKRLVLWRELLGRPAGAAARATSGRCVLVVGGAGYLGSVLVRQLLARGYRVRVLDLLLFGKGPLKEVLPRPGFELLAGDMRNIATLTRALVGVDAVINLAAVVGDPACSNLPTQAIETNYLANKALAEACKYHQINRFLYASTCSVYGAMSGRRALTEASPLNPVSLYARSKIQAEAGIVSLVDDNFAPTILRMGTLYGWSPRMRFDLVVNTMTRAAYWDRRITVHGGGRQWRPLLHVEDAAAAYLACLEAPLRKVGGQVFNVGSDAQNYRIIEIARAVHRCLPRSRLVVEGASGDPRDYAVSFAKLHRRLGFRPRHTLARGIARIIAAFRRGEITNPRHPRYYNVDQLEGENR